jgi:hypothetical protein
MLNKEKLITYLSISVFSFLYLITSVLYSPVYAACPSGVSVNSTSLSDTPTQLCQLPSLLNYVITALYVIVEISFFVMIMVLGYKYMVSRGDPKKTAEVRTGLTFTVVGFVLVFASYIILVLLGKIIPFNTSSGTNTLLNNGQVQIAFP